jgi:serine O-acetyltransferase
MQRTSPTAETLTRFRDDAARWVRPQEIAPIDQVTPMVMASLLLRHPPLRAMAWFRIATLAKYLGVRGVPSWVQRRLLRLYGLELVPGSDIGGGFYIAHPVGCVLVAESIGRNVTVIGQVTFGTRTDNRWPRIGDRVFVGAGARILGGIDIGEGASVGSNAVVMESVTPGTTVVGIPARPVVKGATRQSD